eukprot:709815-Rhodomonas_salina.1
MAGGCRYQDKGEQRLFRQLDLIVAADVFVYQGDLARLFQVPPPSPPSLLPSLPHSLIPQSLHLSLPQNLSLSFSRSLLSFPGARTCWEVTCARLQGEGEAVEACGVR